MTMKTNFKKGLRSTWNLSYDRITVLLMLLFATSCHADTRGPGGVPDNDITLTPQGQADSKDRVYPSKDLVFRASSWNRETNKPVDITSAIRLVTYPGPVKPISHGGTPTKVAPAFADLEFLGYDGSPWVKFNSVHREVWITKDDGAGTGVPLNLRNNDYGDLAIRFIRGDLPHPWIINLPGEKENNQFAILRDWLFTSIMWDEEGRTLMGRLKPHPPANDPAKARVNVRGHKDEVQFLVEADQNQTQPIMQIGDHGNTQSYVTVGATGHLGLGEQNPQSILTVTRDSDTDPVADAWTVYSSKRWKTNIKTIEGALDTVQNLRGVSFDWKESGKKDIGLVAEEVAEVIPEVVTFDQQEAQTVDYARLVAILIEAVKEQQNQLKRQQNIITSQKVVLETLQAQVEALSSQIHNNHKIKTDLDAVHYEPDRKR